MQISTSEITFILTLFLQIIGIIGLTLLIIYIILILHKTLKILSHVNRGVPQLMKDVESISSSAAVISKEVASKDAQIGVMIESASVISSDIANISSEVNSTVNDVKSVFDNTKKISSQVSQIANIVSTTLKNIQDNQSKKDDVVIKNVKMEVKND